MSFRRIQNFFKILSRRIQVCKFLPRFARFLRCCPVFILMEMPFCPKAGHFLPCFKILPSNFYLYFLFTIFSYFSSLFYNNFSFRLLLLPLFTLNISFACLCAHPDTNVSLFVIFSSFTLIFTYILCFFSLYELLYFD